MELAHHVSLVTGAAKRVGRTIALALAARGADVAVHYYRSEAEAQATARQIAAHGVRAEAIEANLADPQAIETLMEQVRSRFERLDLLVNSASAFQAKNVLDVTVEEWDAVMAVNLRAPFLLSQHAARMMQAQGQGVIVNIADIAGQVPWPRYPHHSVSKAGLIMLTRVLAKALAPAVRVNAIVPGPVLKPEGMPDERWAKLGERLPLQRTGSPEHVAQAVLALIQNDFVTGAIWNVDGGDALVGSVDRV